MGLAALTATSAMAGGAAYAINTNPPTGPGNVEIFSKRDMVAVEGYADKAGQTATFTVHRDGDLIGSTKGTIDATGFLEANHPGGVCWGNETDLKVTPDIRGGDVVRVTFADGDYDEATTQDVEITGVTSEGTALTISGRYGAGVDMPGTDLATDPGKFGVEIVQPDMRDGTSAVGERAIGWPVEADEVTTGYTVSGTVQGSDAEGGTFAVTYTFDQATDLDLAEAGEHVALAWQAEPADPNVEAQLGLTMYENGESAGPGMGGCPAGPQEMRPNTPMNATAKAVDSGVDVTWDEATVAPESPAVTGYVVRAVDTDGNEVGKRLGADARSVTLTGLNNTTEYTVEVSARSAVGESFPPATMRVTAGEHVAPSATLAVVGATADSDGAYPPLSGESGVVFDPGTGLTGGVTVHYTTNGSEPTVASRSWTPSQGPIPVSRTTTFRWLAKDAGNITGAQGGPQEVKIVVSTTAAPTISAVVAKDGAADLTFGAVADATAYTVRVFEAGGTTPVSEQEVTATAVDGSITHEVTGLTNGTEYTFTVAALVAGVWTADSAPSAPVTPSELPAANAGADQSTFRGRTVTLDGSASKQADAFAWKQVGEATDPQVELTGGDTNAPTFTFPTIPAPGVPAADATLEFELTITAGEETFTDTVVVTAQADSITADRNRYRPGKDLRVSGTGTQEGAVLYFRDAGRVEQDGAAIAPVITTATVTNGAWALPNQPALGPASNRYHVTSSHGYVGTIQLTR